MQRLATEPLAWGLFAGGVLGGVAYASGATLPLAALLGVVVAGVAANAMTSP